MASKIAEILEQYERLAELDVDYEDRAAPYLKAALLAEMLELVGEDEPRSNYAFGNVCEAAWQQANWTRQALRDKLKEYYQ